MSGSLNTVTMETLCPEAENSLKVSSTMQNVARQDSGVPEDLVSPVNDEAQPLNGEEDPDRTMNSECNITVIHITESQNGKMNEKSLAENKDSKDGSDSGVEGCATEAPRVSFNVICCLQRKYFQILTTYRRHTKNQKIHKKRKYY